MRARVSALCVLAWGCSDFNVTAPAARDAGAHDATDSSVPRDAGHVEARAGDAGSSDASPRDAGGKDASDDVHARADARTEAGVGKTDAAKDAGNSYTAVQAELEAKRYPGPITAQGSTGTCTESRLVWRESGGALHSWLASNASTVNYTFQAPDAVDFFPSDTFIAVDSSDFQSIDVYDTTKAGSLIATLPYAYSVAAGSDGVFLIDQVDGTSTQVQHWIKSSGTTVAVGMALPTAQPPSSFGLNQLVVPESVNVPYPLYIEDVTTGVISSVTFDGALTIYDTLSSSLGLVVSYATSGPVPAIRLYQGDQNAATSRVEVGSEIANIPPLFAGSPATEHNFLAHIALDGTNLLYDSAFGIFAYSLENGTLTAVQLGFNEAVFVADILCVIESTRTLVYRVQGDSTGQVWAVPLAGILP